MGPVRAVLVALALLATLILLGCAGRRLFQGEFGPAGHFALLAAGCLVGGAAVSPRKRR